MKTALFLLCVFFAAAAFGQSTVGVNVLSAQPQMLSMPSHPERAAQRSMAVEQSILEGHSFTSAQGEIPLWEVAPKPVIIPLGDTARSLRKEHEAAKKAEVVWEN